MYVVSCSSDMNHLHQSNRIRISISSSSSITFTHLPHSPTCSHTPYISSSLTFTPFSTLNACSSFDPAPPVLRKYSPPFLVSLFPPYVHLQLARRLGQTHLEPLHHGGEEVLHAHPVTGVHARGDGWSELK